MMSLSNRIVDDKKLQDSLSRRVDAQNRQAPRRRVDGAKVRVRDKPLQLSHRRVLRRSEGKHLNELDADGANYSHVNTARVVVRSDALRHPLEAQNRIEGIAEAQRVGLAREGADGIRGVAAGVEDVKSLAVEGRGAEAGVHFGGGAGDEAARGRCLAAGVQREDVEQGGVGLRDGVDAAEVERVALGDDDDVVGGGVDPDVLDDAGRRNGC